MLQFWLCNGAALAEKDAYLIVIYKTINCISMLYLLGTKFCADTLCQLKVGVGMSWFNIVFDPTRRKI